MGTLIDALRTEDTKTANGMTSNSTSLNSCVDMFFNIGAMRGKAKVEDVLDLFVKAYAEDKLTALKLAFWARNPRGGAGERQIFRDIANHLVKGRNKKSIKLNLALIPELGRWDDLLVFIGTSLENDVLALIKAGLADESTRSLTAKWLPRPTGKNAEKRAIANTVRKYLGMNPKAYRKLLVEYSNTVEQVMCSKDWSSIDYSKIPSKAMSDYMSAFKRNDESRFNMFLEALENGETKINASAIYPYDVIKNLKQGNARGADAQWNSLPNYMEGNAETVLPIVDTSYSMNCPAGDNPSLECMDVAISLGMYISERNEGPFKDAFFNFDSSPTLNVLKGTLSERYNQVSKVAWGGSTNLEMTFDVLLAKAKSQKVSAEDMPSVIMILSDMQFNEAVNGRYRSEGTWNPTAQAMLESQYAAAGYKMPKIVYWNLNAQGDVPVAFDKTGTALVSGFSPALLASILSGGEMTPMSMMMEIINSGPYDNVKV
jgi:hypothetical protein|tara:strand:+ start:35723 stop:37183 length:1461 start_codon:yes stop_codon:yes gene_type:complete